jgi:hypothetical protein
MMRHTTWYNWQYISLRTALLAPPCPYYRYWQIIQFYPKTKMDRATLVPSSGDLQPENPSGIAKITPCVRCHSSGSFRFTCNQLPAFDIRLTGPSTTYISTRVSLLLYLNHPRLVPRIPCVAHISPFPTNNTGATQVTGCACLLARCF